MDFFKIILTVGGILFIPTLLKGNEEPSDFIDINTGTVNPSQNDDLSLLVDFCPPNYADYAGTTNFSLHEFHSKDGTLVPKFYRGYIQILMEQLEVIRSQWDERLILTSPYRSPQHNKAVGGVSNSMHLCGKGSDFIVENVSPQEVQDATEYLMNTGQIINGGLGRYNTFTHYDIGNTRRWDKRN